MEIIIKENLEKTDPLYEIFNKYIGKQVRAGGELKYVDGEIVNIAIDEECDNIWYIVKDKNGFLSEWTFSELKFPKLKVAYS